MTPTHSGQTVSQLSPEWAGDDLDFLRQGLLLGEGFQLYLVGAQSVDARRRAIDYLVSTPGIVAGLVTRDQIVGVGLSAAISKAFADLPTDGKRPVVFVSEIDELIARDPRVLARLNQQRNELIAWSAGAIVVIAAPGSVAAIRRAAPDTWSVRSADVNVDWLAPTPPQHLDENHHLGPLNPPGSDDDLDLLEERLSANPPGDDRGRIALRLAEVCEFDRRCSARTRAALYFRAGAEIQDPWFRCLAYANASRAWVVASDKENAAKALELAIKFRAPLDSGMQSYVTQTEALYLSKFDDPKGALKAWERAIEEAWSSGDHDLVAEARLQRAEANRTLSQLENASADARAGEDEASRTGDFRLLVWAHRLRGVLAVELGQLQEARFAWQRFLELAQSKKFDAHRLFVPLVDAVGEWDEFTAPVAADHGWRILTALADESGLQLELSAAVLRHLANRVMSGDKPVTLHPWRHRIESLIADPLRHAHLTVLEFLTLRENLNRGVRVEIPADPASFFGDVGAVLHDDYLSLIGRMTWLSLLDVHGRKDAAAAGLRELMSEENTRRMTFSFLAHQSRSTSDISKMASPDRTFVALFVSWLGGVGVAQDVATVLTGAAGERLVNRYLKPLKPKTMVAYDLVAK
jgi:tetratricopeptide (TPR) repeat protein